jgi:very-short-patch-repair endonuclease
MYPLRRSIAKARELRKQLTPPEARLWTALRRCGLNGLRFRRQHPIGPFILDFFCPSARLAVEIDGATHTLGDSEAYDARRDLYLKRVGLTVLHIPAIHVRDSLDAVLREIARAAGRPALEAPCVALWATLPPEGEERRDRGEAR